MENVWYNAPLTAVSMDITRVGGQYATLGMVRYDESGKRYLLVKYSGSNSSGASKPILGFDGGGAWSVDLSADGGRCTGVPTLAPNAMPGGNLVANNFLWIQTYGEATNVSSVGSVGSQIKSQGSGIGGTITLQPIVASATRLVGSIGWGVTSTTGTSQTIFIDPKEVLE